MLEEMKYFVYLQSRMTAQSPTFGYGAPVPTKLLPPQQSFVMTATETSSGDLVMLRAAGLTLSVLPWNSKGTQLLVSIWRAESIPASLDVGTARETVLNKASRATEVILRPNIVNFDSGRKKMKMRLVVLWMSETLIDFHGNVRGFYRQNQE